MPILLALVALTAILLLGLWVRVSPLDIYIFRWVNLGYVTPALDLVSLVGFMLGTIWFTLLLAAVLYVVGRRHLGISLAVASLANSLAVLGFKLLFNRPRPWQVLGGVRIVGSPLYGQGYFSGHAAQAFLSAYLLSCYLSPRWYLQVILYLLAAGVSLSRVYDGEHFPVDVIVGALEGLLAGYLWVRLWPWLLERAEMRRRS